MFRRGYFGQIGTIQVMYMILGLLRLYPSPNINIHLSLTLPSDKLYKHTSNAACNLVILHCNTLIRWACIKTYIVGTHILWVPTTYVLMEKYGKVSLNEPIHDKTNKMACAPSEDSDQPGHLPSQIRDFAVRVKKAWVLRYPLNAQRWLWSDWVDAQTDLSLGWVHSHFVGFVMRWIKLSSNTHLVSFSDFDQFTSSVCSS